MDSEALAPRTKASLGRELGFVGVGVGADLLGVGVGDIGVFVGVLVAGTGIALGAKVVGVLVPMLAVGTAVGAKVLILVGTGVGVDAIPPQDTIHPARTDESTPAPHSSTISPPTHARLVHPS